MRYLLLQCRWRSPQNPPQNPTPQWVVINESRFFTSTCKASLLLIICLCIYTYVYMCVDVCVWVCLHTYFDNQRRQHGLMN